MNWRDPKHPKAGGAEIVTLEHAKRWVQKGHTVTWLTSWFQGVPNDEMINGIQIIRRGGSMTVFLAAPWYYLTHASQFSVIVDEIHGLPFFTPLYTRKPKVAFIHEIAKEIWQYGAGFPINTIGRFLEPIYLFLYRDIPFWTDAPSTVTELVEQGIPENGRKFKAMLLAHDGLLISAPEYNSSDSAPRGLSGGKPTEAVTVRLTGPLEPAILNSSPSRSIQTFERTRIRGGRSRRGRDQGVCVLAP